MPWSEEQRRLQSDRIRQRMPWIKSTGPRTDAGKTRSSQNSFKGGKRQIMRGLEKLIRGLKPSKSTSQAPVRKASQ